MRADVAVVVLQRALARRVAAAVDDEDQQRQDSRMKPPNSTALADEHGLAVGDAAGARAGRARLRRGGPACGARRPRRRRTSQESPKGPNAPRAAGHRGEGYEAGGGMFAAAREPFRAAGRCSLARVEAVRVHATEELPAIAEPGLAMGRYRLGARLGAGGFGTVYAAPDERLGRPVAVKVIPGDGPAPERAQREARAVARLDHAGDRRAVRRRRAGRLPLPGLRAGRGPHAGAARGRRRAVGPRRRCGSGSRSPTRSPTPTSAA